MLTSSWRPLFVIGLILSVVLSSVLVFVGLSAALDTPAWQYYTSPQTELSKNGAIACDNTPGCAAISFALIFGLVPGIVGVILLVASMLLRPNVRFLRSVAVVRTLQGPFREEVIRGRKNGGFYVGGHWLSAPFGLPPEVISRLSTTPTPWFEYVILPKRGNDPPKGWMMSAQGQPLAKPVSLAFLDGYRGWKYV